MMPIMAASTLLFVLLFATLASSSLSLHLSYQWLHVVPLQEHVEAARPRGDAESLQWTSGAVEDETGFSSLTLRMMHRDSPFSPLANPHATPQQLLLDRLNRDVSRAAALYLRAHLSAHGPDNGALAVDDTVAYTATREARAHGSFTGPLISGFKQGSGEYFIRLGVGTPARQAFMVVDTGSDIMWIQCAPCMDCYEQSGPVFNPATSSSFRKLSCTSPICGMLELHGCGGRKNRCLYQVAYGDGSFTAGEFSMEELSFEEGRRARVAMGCGHDNEGLFAGAGGLLGLGGGALSFPSQMGRRYRREFSYCLMDRDREGHSTLIFGGGGGVEGVAYTPLIRNANVETFYYVSMSGISVGGELLTIPAQAFKLDGRGGGGVIVDSGTSVTRLVEVAYGPLRSAFKAATRHLRFAGGFSLFDTCYDLSGHGHGNAGAAVKLPTLSLHFAGGLELALPASNYFIPVDSQGTYCLAFASTPGDLSIIGNIQQQGFRVFVDTASSRLGFAPNQC